MGTNNRIRRQFAALLALLWVAGACQHDGSKSQGIQEDYLAYVPARIAVTPCRLIPQGVVSEDLKPTNLPAEMTAGICAQVDKFVLQGFEGQPFMKGLTPSVVQELLNRSGNPDLLSQLDGIWGQAAINCEECESLTDLYKKKLLTNARWQIWLDQLSKSAANADALLVPFLTYAARNETTERGLKINDIGAQVVVLLIDTAKGDLIWSGVREANVANRKLMSPSGEVKVEAPPLDLLMPRLLANDIWREFPGRQFL
jgi:hypothetical protein